MGLDGSKRRVRDRLVIGRSRVRIPPRALKPQVRGYFRHCWLRRGDRRSFLWADHALSAGAPLRYVESVADADGQPGSLVTTDAVAELLEP